jgi:hypothetical protein
MIHKTESVDEIMLFGHHSQNLEKKLLCITNRFTLKGYFFEKKDYDASRQSNKAPKYKEKEEPEWDEELVEVDQEDEDEDDEEDKEEEEQQEVMDENYGDEKTKMINQNKKKK